jgi:hypothetical protein
VKHHICIKPVIGGLSYHDAKLLMKNIESMLNYNNYKKQIRIIDDIAKEFTVHQSNVNWE